MNMWIPYRVGFGFNPIIIRLLNNVSIIYEIFVAGRDATVTSLPNWNF